ncbi:hypothetical protein [uncultured Jatrophihabitans sp.]|uniref:hypothetical protein n=1 Tax=uncultured Jatrophihabitans sp. TaxID=1610747 RepID=UPI0035C9E309
MTAVIVTLTLVLAVGGAGALLLWGRDQLRAAGRLIDEAPFSCDCGHAVGRHPVQDDGTDNCEACWCSGWRQTDDVVHVWGLTPPRADAVVDHTEVPR